MISIQCLIAFPILLILYYSVPDKWQKHVLMLANIAFALFLGPYTLLALILISTVVYVGIKTMVHNTSRRFRMILIISMVLIALIGIKIQPLFANIKPIQIFGISFYSLRLIAYVVDVYHGQEEVHGFEDYLCFISFFPIFTAGPIEKSEHLIKELSVYKAFDEKIAYRGFIMILYGLFFKQVIADRIGVMVDEVYGDISGYSGAVCLLIVVLYSVQIYADFAGYSYIAMGMSGMLGIDVVKNFNRPYLTVSIRDFWRRWHISLSRWLRDYIYIPLGGNKKGQIRKSINIMITFLISGLWHGIGLNFLVWGGLHGLYQVVEDTGLKLFKKKTDSLIGRVLHIILTFILVTIAWIFFRSDSVSQATEMIRRIITDCNIGSLTQGTIFELGLGSIQITGLLIALIIMVVSDIMLENNIISLDKFTSCPAVIRWVVSYVMIIWVVTAAIQLYGTGETAGFIYAAF